MKGNELMNRFLSVVAGCLCLALFTACPPIDPIPPPGMDAGTVDSGASGGSNGTGGQVGIGGSAVGGVGGTAGSAGVGVGDTGVGGVGGGGTTGSAGVGGTGIAGSGIAGSGGVGGGGGGGGIAGAAGVGGAPPYTLVFSDDFDGAALDRTKWCTRYVYGGGNALQLADPACTGPRGTDGTLDFLNDEQERYVDYNTASETMHVVGGGTLSLRATKTRADAYASYEAAMIRSKFEFKPSDTASYFITAKVRLPSVIGTWPALWLNSGFGTNGKTQWPPEVDIFEGALNGRDDKVSMLHMAAPIGGLQTASKARELTYPTPGSSAAMIYDTNWGNYLSPTSVRDVWITVSAVWTASSVCYGVNGLTVACENYRWFYNDGSAANPAHLLLNLAVGGGWAGRYGIDTTGFPTTFDIDYVRVYQFSGQTMPASLPN